MIALVPNSFGSTLMERHVPGEPHEYSSTQVNLNGRVAQLQRQLAAAIPDEDLAEDGRETKPHVTVKFGIHGDNVAAVRRALAGEGPIRLRFGKTSFFPNGESGAGDVVKVDVVSPDLHRLNRKIAAAVKTTDTHPEYRPHLTIAYVKPGLGRKYAGLDAMEGLTVTVDTVLFSDRLRQMHPIHLAGTIQEHGDPNRPGDYPHRGSVRQRRKARARGMAQMKRDAGGAVGERQRKRDAAMAKGRQTQAVIRAQRGTDIKGLHYSPQSDLTVIEPRSQRPGDIPVSYFFEDLPQFRVDARKGARKTDHAYEVDLTNVYDLDADPLKLKDMDVSERDNRRLQRLGFSGVKQFGIVQMYGPVPVRKRRR